MKSNLLVMVFVVIVLLIMSMIGCTKSTTSLAPVPTVCGFIAGHNANDEDNTFTNGTLLAVSFTASNNVSLKSLTSKLDLAGTFEMGVYSDNAGLPGTLLGQTLAQTSVVGWNTVTLTPISIISGTKYWLAVLSPGAGIVATSAAGGNGSMRISAVYETILPANPSGWAFHSLTVSLYASGCN